MGAWLRSGIPSSTRAATDAVVEAGDEGRTYQRAEHARAAVRARSCRLAAVAGPPSREVARGVARLRPGDASKGQTALRRRRGGGALRRMDRQHGASAQRYAVLPALHAAEAAKYLVEAEQDARRATRGRGPDAPRRPRCGLARAGEWLVDEPRSRRGAHRHARARGSARTHGGSRRRLRVAGPLSAKGLPALDQPGEARRDTRAPHRRGREARGRTEAQPVRSLT